MDKLRSLFDALCRTAEAFPDQPAWLLLDNEERASSAFLPTAQTSMELGNQRPRIITWRETQATVERLAYWLSEQGLREGDRIANLERNSFEWACLDLACAALGCIHSPLDTRAGSESIRRSIGLLEPRVVFGCNPSVLDCPTMSLRSAMTAAVQAPVERLRASWSDRDRSSETATILWTSGTTSQPKGAMLSHSNLLSNATAKLDAMPQSETDLRLNLLPFAHAYARTCELTTWLLTGGTMACVGSVREFLDVAPRIQPTLINSVPSMIEAFLVPRDRESIVSPKGSSGENCDDLLAILGGSVRRLASGGAGISASTRELFANAGLPIYQG